MDSSSCMYGDNNLGEKLNNSSPKKRYCVLMHQSAAPQSSAIILWLSCPRPLTSIYMYGSLKNPWTYCGDIMESACVCELGRYGSEGVEIHRKQQACISFGGA